MYIHFSFSKYKDNIPKQIDELLNTILSSRRLLFKKNPEFIPVFQTHIHPKYTNKEVHHIGLESFKKSIDVVVADSSTIEFVNPKSDFYFLKEDVGMICFTSIAFNKLRNSFQSNMYGKLGLVFNESFLKKSGMRPVHYYQEETLYDDPLIREWNLKYAYKANLSAEERTSKKELETIILAFRKPATLFNSFLESRQLAIQKTLSGIDMRIEDAYDRYPTGYHFHNENEWRIVNYDNEYLCFSETDLDAIIPPDLSSKKTLEKYFDRFWKYTPKILIHP